MTSSKQPGNIYVDQHPEDPTKYYLAMKDLIMASLDAQPHRDLVRIHESGDFWNEELHESLDACSKRTSTS